MVLNNSDYGIVSMYRIVDSFEREDALKNEWAAQTEILRSSDAFLIRGNENYLRQLY